MTDLTPAEIDELEAKARAATPGPWLFADDDPFGMTSVNAETKRVCRVVGDSVETIATAEHIAAFDPPTVLALCAMAKAKIAAEERVRELEAARIVDKSINLPKAEPFFVTQESFDGLCEQIQNQCDFINTLTTRLEVPSHLPSLAAIVDWIEARVLASLSAEKEEGPSHG